jgi:hypothetical protein
MRMQDIGLLPDERITTEPAQSQTPHKDTTNTVMYSQTDLVRAQPLCVSYSTHTIPLPNELRVGIEDSLRIRVNFPNTNIRLSEKTRNEYEIKFVCT